MPALFLIAAMTLTAMPPATDVVIAGEPLAEWRERMSRIDLADPQSGQWVPGLIAVIEADSVPWFTRRQAALTLGRMRDTARDAVPVLRRLLDDAGDDPDTAPQLWALKALALFGPVAKDAAPEIGRLLRSSTTTAVARLTAIEALSQIGPTHPVVIPTLIEFAGDPAEPALRRAAIEALGLNGPAAGSALPTLVRTLDDADENLRRETATSLGKLGPQAEAAQFSLLERMTFDDIAAVQDAAATALAAIGPVVGPQLMPLLDSEDLETRRRAISIIGAWRTNAAPWQPAVQAHWDDPSPAVRLAALEATWQITRRGDAIAPRIAAELAGDDRSLRLAAVRLLARMGPAAKSAAAVLHKLSHHDRPDVRLAAQKALQALNAR